jgi:cytochrome c-type biogenesis protein CcmH/NrfF
MASAEKTNESTPNGITLAQILSKDGEPIEEEGLAEEIGDGPEENEEATQVAKEGFCVECEGNSVDQSK